LAGRTGVTPLKAELVLPLTCLADRLADPQRGLSRSMLGQVDYRTNRAEGKTASTAPHCSMWRGKTSWKDRQGSRRQTLPLDMVAKHGR